MKCFLLPKCELGEVLQSACHSYVAMDWKKHPAIMRTMEMQQSNIAIAPILLVGTVAAMAFLFSLLELNLYRHKLPSFHNISEEVHVMLNNFHNRPSGHYSKAALGDTLGECPSVDVDSREKLSTEIDTPRVDMDSREKLSAEIETPLVSTTKDFSADTNMGLDTGASDLVSPRREACMIIYTLVGLALVTFCVGWTFMPFPDDKLSNRRGFCGLVRDDWTPLSFGDLFQPQVSHYLSNGTLYNGLEVMPEHCWSVVKEDKIREQVGLGCYEWCESEFGSFPRPLCSLLTGFGAMFRVCLKTRIWTYSHVAFGILGRGVKPYITLLLTLLYGLLSVLLAWINAQDNKTTEKNPPKRDKCLESGPYHGKRQIVLCGRRATTEITNDYTVATRKMTLAQIAGFADPSLDLNCALTFLKDGQPFYALFMWAVFIVPHADDPLQTRSTEMFLSARSRGFPVRGTYVIKAREGSYEATLACILGMHSMMRSAFVNYDDVDLGASFLAVILTVMSSLLTALPNAADAREVLLCEARGLVDCNDFYAVNRTIGRLGSRRYLPSCDCLALGFAVAVTFQTNRLLLALWWIGVLIGVLLYFCYFLPFVAVSRPSCKGCCGFVLAFVFWFMAPTRLAGLPQIQAALYNGTLPLFQCALRGCSSLAPDLYYLHRISTLCCFWIYTGYYHMDFFIHLFVEGVMHGHHYIATSMVVTGWVSIIMLAVLYFMNMGKFQMAVSNRTLTADLSSTNN